MLNTSNIEDLGNWGFEEFGDAKLGNGKRTTRLVKMAQGAAERSAGKVTEIFQSPADRQGAYKFFENKKIQSSDVALAAHLACARRCADEKCVFVPIDGTSLSLVDASGVKDLGPVGPKGGGNGVEVMSAIAVRLDGTPLGIIGQSYWTRDRDNRVKHTRKLRPLEEKETRYWLDIIGQTENALAAEGNSCKPWYQLDRGGDFRELLMWANDTSSYVTVRAAQDRRVIDAETRLLWESLDKQTLYGMFELAVSGNPNRKPRTASLHVRAGKVTLLLPGNKTATLTAVLVREEDTVPDGDKPIEWLLLTNKEVTNFDDARLVIFGYSQRWRIEEFHKTWKSVCRIEDTQLRDFDAIVKLAILLASVAMRVERLKYLARTTPTLPANIEFSRYEIDALIILQKPKGYKRGQMPTISEAVSWLANLGGYTGKSSGGPAGSIVISRGLMRIQEAARVVEEIA
jgi:hypothetical protein